MIHILWMWHISTILHYFYGFHREAFVMGARWQKSCFPLFVSILSEIVTLGVSAALRMDFIQMRSSETTTHETLFPQRKPAVLSRGSQRCLAFTSQPSLRFSLLLFFFFFLPFFFFSLLFQHAPLVFISTQCREVRFDSLAVQCFL